MTTTEATPATLPEPRVRVRARWPRPAFAGLLAGTALLYLVGLGSSGWANAFYSAAAQAGSQNLTAFLFGSSDASNAITVDKTPAFLWVIDVSVTLFGLNTWSILVPQALEGVAAVAVLYATVRRWFPPGAALLAGAALAVTPVATLMFRFNNPDALLVLLLTAAAYATTRALERDGGRWLFLAGVLVGFGFLTKMLQALVIVPVVAVVYLVCAPAGRRIPGRVRDLLLGGLGLVLAAGWWIALAELVPASARPYIGGTQHDSVLELTFGYNGFGRLTGNETGGLGNMNADAGPLRLFGSEMGGQVSWLLPAALVLLAGLLWLTRRAPRTDRTRAAALLWGGWLLLTGAVISLSQGIIHPYYTVALAPAIAALVGIGGGYAWRHSRPLSAGSVAVAVIWSYALLDRTPGWQPWLRFTVLFGGLLAASALGLAAMVPRRLAPVAGIAAVATVLAGPLAYSVSTAASPHTGAIPSAGPAGSGRFGGGPGTVAPGGTGPRAGQATGNGPGGGPGGTGNGGRQAAPGTGTGGPMTRGGGMNLLDAPTPDASVVTLLRANHSRYSWVAATVGSNSAAGYQLATGYPVMAIGGFNGTDAYPTLAQFQRYVARGRIHWFVGGDGAAMRATSGSQAAQRIADWVAAHYSPRTVGGTTLYDLTAPAS